LLFIFLIRFSLLLFIFLTGFSLTPLSLSCSSSSSSWPWRYSLSHLSLYGRGGPLSLLFCLDGVFNLYNTDFFFPRFSIYTVLVFFFFSYITIVVNLYNIGFCVYWFFNRYSIGFFFLSYKIIVVNLYSIAHGKKKKKFLLVFVFTTYINIYLFFLLLVFVFTGFFHLYSTGYLFIYFFYITIVVNLYDTAHGKKNKRIVFGFCFYSIHQYLFIFLLLAFVFTGVFSLYSIGYFFFPI
jgi:hypothetical protein